jgi:tRNA(fMet)-specific endonuclease VapC
VIYLLDTNTVIALLKERSSQIRVVFERVEAAGHTVFLSAISLHELWYGVARSDRPEKSVNGLRNFLSGGYEILPFDGEDAETAGNVRGELADAGTPIGPYDILIAGQAIRRNATLVTANEKEFRRVPGLKWENWLK